MLEAGALQQQGLDQGRGQLREGGWGEPGVTSMIQPDKMYLYGTEYEAVTDHQPLCALYNSTHRNLPTRVDNGQAPFKAGRIQLQAGILARVHHTQ